VTDTIQILIIDDDRNLRQTLSIILRRNEYVVTEAATGREGLRFLGKAYFDMVFLDLKLPDLDGLVVLPQIHEACPDTPVLILTAHATLESAIEAVRLGARDYILKPMDPPYILTRVREILNEQSEPRRRRELIAQVQGILSELHQLNGSDAPVMNLPPALAAADPARYLRRGSLILDLHTRHVLLDDRYIPLSPTTFDYLVILARHSPDMVPYVKLVREAQGYDVDQSEAREIVRWHIHEIRKKLEENPRNPKFIITVRHAGYRLVT
jgi:DNA-binding response OmpR family regulator